MTEGHRMHRNSLDAYAEIVGSLSAKRSRVLAAIKTCAPVTRQSLAENILQWDINRVTGRVRELIDLGLVVEAGASTGHRHPRALLVAVAEEDFVPQKKPMTLHEQLEEARATITAQQEEIDRLHEALAEIRDAARQDFQIHRMAVRALDNGGE